jgi:N-carbamoylputrescine amidase
MPAKKKGFKLCLVQMSCDIDPSKNLNKAISFIEEAAFRGAEMVCLQELFRNQYIGFEENHDHYKYAESIPGPTIEALGKVAKKLGLVIIAPIFERKAPGVHHNSAATIGRDGRVIDVYRKMHIPDDPGYYEKFYFTPGDLGFKSVKTHLGRISTQICWDQWFPEAARLSALAGADILCYPTAIGVCHNTAVSGFPKEIVAEEQRQIDAWITIQRAHAIANGIFVAVVNRVGLEHQTRFWGNSFVCNPFGEIIAKASYDREEVLLADIDFATNEFYRQYWPFLRDRRIDAYSGILKHVMDNP